MLEEQRHTTPVSAAHAESTHPAAPIVVYPPPATEREVLVHCSRRTAPTNVGSSSGGRSRARARADLRPVAAESSSEDLSSPDAEPSSPLSARSTVSHPYARIYAKRESPTTKRRKMWNHMLEKSLFTPDELASIGAPQRRTIYIASLEAHIDQLHARLLELGLYPVAFETLEPYHGLNSKTAKVGDSGLLTIIARVLTTPDRVWWRVCTRTRQRSVRSSWNSSARYVIIPPSHLCLN